ncbi:hypothetical protein ACMD2_08504 [Ananas comosus]|uniref:PLAT domain-containing protein n=1 Tax=Ananas comosus TaxID=4615 RepID=A0A199V3T9_ANACO|nr:hypothetical protein ACMD2_08504 [Ananas comosus]
MARHFPSLLLLVTLLLPFLTNGDDDDSRCVYTVYVRTGSVIKSGTDATVGLTLADASGREVSVPDLVAWGGLMGPAHDYFERANLDVFSGRGPCGLGPLCRLNLTSDGWGPHHGWYCEYVEVTLTGPHTPCAQTLFYVRQWLAADAAPYQLYATVDGCGGGPARAHKAQQHVMGRVVIGDGPNAESI